jgi:hypothetical protein
MTDIRRELEELGLEVKIGQEVAEQQWQSFAREYRIVGEKAEALSSMKRDMVTAIMCGDVEMMQTAGGIAVKQWLSHRQNGAPESITYNPPNARHIASAGTDTATISTRWCRIAASLSGLNEGQLTLWLTGRDHTVMEGIVQLFTMA